MYTKLCISNKKNFRDKIFATKNREFKMNFVNLANLAIGCFGLVSADRNVSERPRNFGSV